MNKFEALRNCFHKVCHFYGKGYFAAVATIINALYQLMKLKEKKSGTEFSDKRSMQIEVYTTLFE